MVITLRRLLLALAITAAPAGMAFAAGDARDNATVPAGGFQLGGQLPAVGNGQGEPESPGSLPPGFEAGTVAQQRRNQFQAYRAKQAADEAAVSALGGPASSRAPLSAD